MYVICAFYQTNNVCQVVGMFTISINVSAHNFVTSKLSSEYQSSNFKPILPLLHCCASLLRILQQLESLHFEHTSFYITASLWK